MRDQPFNLPDLAQRLVLQFNDQVLGWIWLQVLLLLLLLAQVMLLDVRGFHKMTRLVLLVRALL